MLQIQKAETPDNTKTDIHIEFLAEESNESHLNTGKALSDEEDSKALRYFARHKRKADSEDGLGWYSVQIFF